VKYSGRYGFPVHELYVNIVNTGIDVDDEEAYIRFNFRIEYKDLNGNKVRPCEDPAMKWVFPVDF
jgi:hypothetical protein